MNRSILAIAVILMLLTSCQSRYAGIPESYHEQLDSALLKAGDNCVEIEKALSTTPNDQKEGMAFLISYMPKRDLTTLTADFLLENITYAYKARQEFPWTKALSKEVFFNEVLPYVNVTEERDQWRKNFYNRFSVYVKDETHLVDAIFAINNNIKEETGVEYNTNRSRVDISPLQAIKESMATCTGLSILLTDALRSVGIPSRLAGTPMWTNMKGNHTWSEVLIDDQWMFTEFYPDSLDRAWFLADAGKSDPDNKLHWIYAVSYKPTDLYYNGGGQLQYLINELDEEMLPEVWRNDPEEKKMRKQNIALDERYIYAENVTQRYIDVYRKSVIGQELNPKEIIANFVVFENAVEQTSQSRISCRVEIWKDGKQIDFGYSPLNTDDNNKFLTFKLEKGETYLVKISDNAQGQQTNEMHIKIVDDENVEYKLALQS